MGDRMTTERRGFFIASLLAIFLLFLAPAAGDWPEYLGGASRPAAAIGAEVSIPAGWKPRIVWRRNIGSGYSGASVQDGVMITAFNRGDSDWIGAFKIKDGEEVWSRRLESAYRGHDGSADGPLATPAIADNRVFALSARGKLAALSLADGKELWRVDLVDEYGVDVPYFGFATSPLVEGDRVVVQAGGDEGKCLMAFHAATGALSWSSQSDETDNASPAALTLPLAESGASSAYLRKCLWADSKRPLRA